MMALNLFQLLSISLALLLALMISVALLTRRVARLPGVFWLLVWLSAAAAIVVPDMTSVVARFLGIRRGADLVLYCAILGGMVGFFLMYVRQRRLEASLTELVRHMAISDPRRPESSVRED